MTTSERVQKFAAKAFLVGNKPTGVREVKAVTGAVLSNSKGFLFTLGIAAGCVCRTIVAFQHGPMEMLATDPGRHWAHIRDPLVLSPLAGIDPIGYQVWLSAIAKLTIGDPIAMSCYTAVLSVLTPWIWYRFAREVLPKKGNSQWCWLLLCWLPSWTAIFGYVMPETLLLPLLGGALWALWRAARKRTISALLVAIVLAAATLLTKLTPLPLLLAGVGLALSRQFERGKAVIYSLGLLVLMLLGPAYRAYRIIHVWAPFGYPAMNTIYYRSGCAELRINFTNDAGLHWLYGFASPQNGQKPLAPLSSWQSSRSGTVEANINLQHGTQDWTREIEMKSRGASFLPTLWKENAIFFMFGESWPDNNPNRLPDLLQIKLRWMWAALVMFVLLGNTRRFLRDRKINVFAAAVSVSVIALVLQTTGYVEGRYRKPFEGPLLMNAVWLLSSSTAGRKKKEEHDEEVRATIASELTVMA